MKRWIATVVAAGLTGPAWIPAATDGARTPDAQDGGITNIPLGDVVKPFEYPAPELLTPQGIEVLKQERRRFAAELRDVLKYRPNDAQTTSRAREHIPEMSAEAVEKILARMEEGARNTVQDNLQRFHRALAERIPIFAKAMALYDEGQFMRALDTTIPLTKEKMLRVKFGYAFDTLPPYLYCAVKMFQAQTYGMAGAGRHCVVAYQIAYNKLPSSVSFAPTARARAADMYERSERAHYAIIIHQGMIERLLGSLADTELLRLRVKAMRWMREDPYRLGARMVADVSHRLKFPRLGATTQRNQSQLIEVMNGMLIDPERDDNVFAEYSMNLVGNEISGGMLREGGIAEKLLFTNDVAIVGSDDWGQLRPREKQELLQMFNETYSERYRDMLEEYYRGISVQESNRPAGNGR